MTIACKQSSFAAMQLNQPRYDDALFRELTERRCGLPPGGDASKVRVGGSHRDDLSPGLLAELDVAWQETVGATTELANYDELLAELGGNRPGHGGV